MSTENTLGPPWIWAALAVFVGACYFLAPVLTPFLVGALLAYLGDPLVDQLEKWRLSRTFGVVVVFLIFIVMALTLILLLVPLIHRQIGYLVGKLPQILDWLQLIGLPWLEKVVGIDLKSFDLSENKGLLISAWTYSGNYLQIMLKNITSSGLAFFALVANIALIPIVAFYLLRDWDILMGHIRSLIPRQYEGTVVSLFTECDQRLGAFLRGQLSVMLALGGIYATGLWLFGIELALLIGVLSGLASIIPYLGFAVGIVVATIVAFFQFHDVTHILMVWGIFSVGQLLEGSVLTPLLVGDRIGLHPVAVIFAILAGGQLFGFFGMLLALPVAAASMVFLEHARKKYLESDMYINKHLNKS